MTTSHGRRQPANPRELKLTTGKPSLTSPALDHHFNTNKLLTANTVHRCAKSGGSFLQLFGLSGGGLATSSYGPSLFACAAGERSPP